MSHCKACEAPIDRKNTWRVFNDVEDFSGLLSDEDDLCGRCLQIAEESFKESFYPPDVQEIGIQTFFYHDRNLDLDLLDTGYGPVVEYD